MKTIKIRGRQGPEAIIQTAIIKFLTLRGWLVMKTHGNLYSKGWPDLYICKRSRGTRWVEIKNPLAYHFTAAQLEFFPKMTGEGVGIWIMTAATEIEYAKLFKPPNWWQYLSVSQA